MSDSLPIETILAPLDHLGPHPPISTVEMRLRIVASSLNGSDALRRRAIKSGAMIKLRAAKVPGAKELVEAALGGGGKAVSGQGSPVEFETPEPWPEPVPGDALFDELRRFYAEHIVLPKGGAVALALWTVHTYTAAAADISPYLVLSSPTPRCGKTLVATIASNLVCRSLPSSNISEAALYRMVEKYEPTIIIDEADTFLKDNPHFTGILNSGHSRATAYVYRIVGDDPEPRRFKTFGPKMIALIGRLPAASTTDRSIMLPMRRKTKGETIQPLVTRRLHGDLADLRRRIARWAEDTLPTLHDASPAMPEGLDDRAEDNWRPLLALADAAGGRWPTLAREVTVLLSGDRGEEPGFGVALLEDIRTLFGAWRVVSSEVMLEHLTGLLERPWATWAKHGKPMTQRHLATLLKPFGIRSGTVRVGDATPKGYTLADFEDSFARYLSDFPSATAPQVNDGQMLPLESHPPHPDHVAAPISSLNTDDDKVVADVADRNPETRGVTIFYDL